MAVVTPSAAEAETAPVVAEDAPKVPKAKRATAGAEAVADAVASSESGAAEIVEPIREAEPDVEGVVRRFDVWENSGNGPTPILGDCIIYAPERMRIPAGKRVRLPRGYRQAIGDAAPNHLKFIGEE